MDLHLSFFMIIVAVVKLAASYPGLAEDPSDQLFFDDAALLPDQPLLPSEPGSLDLTELLEDQESSGFLGGLASLSTDTASSLNDFFIASDSVALTDCSTSDNFMFPTIDKSRLKRLDQCEAPDNIAYPPMLIVPTVNDLEEDIRGAIMRENPFLYDLLWSSRLDDEDNTACMLLTAKILPRGACTSGTVADWNYRSTRSFAWNGKYELALWDLSFVTPADKLAMGCVFPLHDFVCCKELAVKGGVLTGIECAFLPDLHNSWARIGTDIQ